MDEVFVTTLNTDHYLPGVLALHRSIRETCVHPLVALVSEGLSAETYETLRRNNIPFYTEPDLALPEQYAGCAEDPLYGHWIKTIFKLRVFEQVRFRKLVYVDSDMMVMESIDDLFEREDLSAAVAGKSYPGNERFRDLNSGIMVVSPSSGLLERLMAVVPEVARAKQHFGDQDVIGACFPEWPDQEWRHLPETYNVFFRHYQYYAKDGPVKVVHFIGKVKPWMMSGGAAFVECLKCLVTGNRKGIPIFLRYRKYVKEST